jgi:antirestriction protein ArdC
MMSQPIKAVLEEKISQLIEQVETAGSWRAPFKQTMALGLPINHHSQTYYSGANIFFLWMEAQKQHYQTNHWLTMKQCNLLKGRVLKGEKSTTVFFFKPIEVEEENEHGEVEKKKVPMLRSYKVFNLDQTTLKPKEEHSQSKVDPMLECEAFFEGIDLCNIQEGTQPYYSPKEDYISMPSIDRFIDAPSYYATLAHEMIHATGHESRLHRSMSSKKAHYAYEELIAELGASFVCAHLGIDAEDIQNNAAAYLKSWLASLKEDPRYLWSAMREASLAFTYLQEPNQQKAVA